MTKALIVVDMQKDFIPGEESKLPIPSGDKVIKPINKLIKAFQDKRLPVIFTRDWHPRRHPSFRKFGEHCLQGSDGALFHNDLNLFAGALILNKGDHPKEDSLSGFGAHDGPHDLDSFLVDLDVGEVFVAGLALDFCVGATCYDAVDKGYKVNLVTDGTKALKFKSGSDTKKKLLKLKVKFVTSSEVTKSLAPKRRKAAAAK